MIRKLLMQVLCVLVGGAMLCGPAVAFDVCGELTNAYGPFDYWSDKDKLGIVESNHFTAGVETLRAGKSGYLGSDIDYTLRAFPNHPRALMAMMKLGEKERTERPAGAHFSVACYFDRAIRFRPNDSMARMIFGTYLAKRKKNNEALLQLEVAEQHAVDNANLHYNMGLVYFDLGKYEEALKHAHAAYRLGFTLPGLRNKLSAVGRWQDASTNAEPLSEERGKNGN